MEGLQVRLYVFSYPCIAAGSYRHAHGLLQYLIFHCIIILFFGLYCTRQVHFRKLYKLRPFQPQTMSCSRHVPLHSLPASRSPWPVSPYWWDLWRSVNHFTFVSITCFHMIWPVPLHLTSTVCDPELSTVLGGICASIIYCFPDLSTLMWNIFF